MTSRFPQNFLSNAENKLQTNPNAPTQLGRQTLLRLSTRPTITRFVEVV